MHSTNEPTQGKFDMRLASNFKLRVHSFRGSWLLLLLVFFIHEAGCNRSSKVEFQERLRGIVGTKTLPQFVLRGEAETAPWKETQVFYRQREFQPAWIQIGWFGARRLRSEGAALLECLRDAWREGLDPAEYPVDELEQQFEKASRSTTPATELAWLDARLSYTFFEYAAHLYRGRVSPKRISPAWQVASRNRELAALLEDALARKNICGGLAKLTPTLPEYAALRQALGVYHRIAQEGGWPLVPDAHSLKKGDQGDAVNLLRNSLERQGDLTSRLSDKNSMFDESLASAVRAFEARNGLPVDGVADPEMLSVLNRPVETVIRQIELNLERMRWLPEELGRRHVRVNIPDYRLQLIEESRTVLEMRVVVGKKENPTPVFSDQMTHVAFNPFWNIPESIAVKETVPLLLKDDDHAAKHGIQVVMKGNEEEIVDPSEIGWKKATQEAKTFPYLLRQRPGPGNALGEVKFMFPNQFNVYLHDTPTRHLFNQTERDYSHGCVRVEHPAELAEYLLKEKPGWNADRIKSAMQSGEQVSVTLANPLPVHIVYWSVWIGEDGELQRRPDIYELDTTQERLFVKRAPRQLSKR
ncbi:MAG: L,D-transpeptidase family protein [Acidobacteria bacterium]|nr:L,D-transpeptidase family protein [Acidobacteriota bacterium]